MSTPTLEVPRNPFQAVARRPPSGIGCNFVTWRLCMLLALVGTGWWHWDYLQTLLVKPLAAVTFREAMYTVGVWLFLHYNFFSSRQ